jgi:hypothetical protein
MMATTMITTIETVVNDKRMLSAPARREVLDLLSSPEFAFALRLSRCVG